MPYSNSCKRCNHTWTSPTEAGAAKTCPNCKTTGTTLIGSVFSEDSKESESGGEPEGKALNSEVTEPEPESDSPVAATTQFEPTDEVSVEVEKSVDLDVTRNDS